jgi:hypothetical protein
MATAKKKRGEERETGIFTAGRANNAGGFGKSRRPDAQAYVMVRLEFCLNLLTLATTLH